MQESILVGISAPNTAKAEETPTTQLSWQCRKTCKNMNAKTPGFWPALSLCHPQKSMLKSLFALLQYEGMVGNCCWTFTAQIFQGLRLLLQRRSSAGGQPELRYAAVVAIWIRLDFSHRLSLLPGGCVTPWPWDTIFHLQQLWMNAKSDCLASDSWQPWAGLGALNLYTQNDSMYPNASKC